MLHPDDLRILHEARRCELLRHAALDRLVAQLPVPRRGARSVIAAWLHALANWLQPSSEALPQLASKMPLQP
jgi:hypothetical protein